MTILPELSKSMLSRLSKMRRRNVPTNMLLTLALWNLMFVPCFLPVRAKTQEGHSGEEQKPKLVERVEPKYPDEALKNGIMGTVFLHVIVQKDGTVKQVEAVSGHPIFLQAAIDAVKQWRYQPTLLNGEPVEVETIVDVTFALSSKDLADKDKTKVAWQGPDKPIYVVTRNHYAEGLGVETPKFGDLIAIEIFNPAARPEKDAVYTVGERLALFVRGRRTGDVRINKVMQFQCDSSAAVVSADPSIHLAKNFMALATNSEKIRPRESGQRQADATEQRYARQLAMNVFRKNGVSEKLGDDIKVDQLIVTRVDDSDSKFLIGSLSVKTEDARNEIFLIGRLGKSEATTELALFHKTKDLLEGTDSENVYFIDQLDLDGDGTDEIVVEVRGYEDEEFVIYKRQNGVWNEVNVGGQGGC